MLALKRKKCGAFKVQIMTHNVPAAASLLQIQYIRNDLFNRAIYKW